MGLSTLDRAISGAGAVTDAADRAVRMLTGGSRGPFAARPGALLLTAILVALTALLVLAGIEATDPASPLALEAGAIGTSRSLGDRTTASVRGSISSGYVETWDDVNQDGKHDPEEGSSAWYYWIVDPATRTGVTVLSKRRPEAIYTFDVRGILLPDRGLLTEDYPAFANEIAEAGLHLDKSHVIDGRSRMGGRVTPVTLGSPLPVNGTTVSLSASRIGSYLYVCEVDYDQDGVCDDDEQTILEIVVFDPASKNAIRVFVSELPDFTTTTMTGIVRRDERTVDAAKTIDSRVFTNLRLLVSDRYVLEESATPRSAPLAFGLAGVVAAIAGTMLIGFAGGYLIYRRSSALPRGATTLAPGQRIPARVTGLLRTPFGLEHVRETPAELVRFVLGRPVGAENSGGREQTTLVVERIGYPQGVAIGLGELSGMSTGRAMTVRAPRPALRLAAGTGPLVLSFDTDAERDRAAAEILDESGLGADALTT